ncbi:MAG: glycosyltransferase family 2 protein [bacterium]|nr:glycosyltransferase family 2 protein [bacterium]
MENSRQPLVSIIVLSYNSKKHLPALFTSLAAQTYSDIEIIVVDNDSQDGTVEWIEGQSILQPTNLIANKTNEWYAKGNNQGIKVAKGDYVIFCNDDVVLKNNHVELLVEVFKKQPDAGMVGGKLLKLTKQDDQSIVDSAGLIMERSRNVLNRGENDIDKGQYDLMEEVFGITGALMMVSRHAIESVKYGDNFFDADFIAYKEDVDASWRMHRAGFQVWYQPQAVAYHARTIQKTSLASRSNKPAIIRGYSYRNHIWTLIKNEDLKSFILDSWAIIPYEFVKLFYVLIREWSTLSYILETIKGIPKMRAKRVSSNKQSIRQWIQ